MAGPGAAAAALLPAVLLAVLAPWAGRGGAAAPTAPNRTLEAELERRWESLVARSLARLPVAAQPKEAAVQSGAGDYLLGIKRLRRLYCNVGIGFHLQVLPDGRIGGVHADTSDSEWGVPDGKGRGPGQRPPLPVRTGRSRPAPARGPWEPERTQVQAPRSWRRRGRNHSWLGESRQGQALRSPAFPPSDVPAPGAEFQRLRRGHRERSAAIGTRARGPETRAHVQAGLEGRGGHLSPAVRDWARPPRGRNRGRTGWTPGAPWGRSACTGELGPFTFTSTPEMGVPGARRQRGEPGRRQAGEAWAQGPVPGNDLHPAPRPTGALAGGAGSGEHLWRGQPVLRGHEQQGQALWLGEYRGPPSGRAGS